MLLQMSFKRHVASARDAAQGAIIGAIHGTICSAISSALQMRFRCGSGVVFPSFCIVLAPLMMLFRDILRRQ